MNRRRRLSLAAQWLVALCVSLGAATNAQNAAPIGLSAGLSGIAEIPPNNSAAHGTVQVSLDRTKNILRWQLDYADLESPATAAHFHAPGISGENASVVLTIDARPSSGEATLSAVQANELLDGKWYVDIHTAAHPDGEIRGQVLPHKGQQAD